MSFACVTKSKRSRTSLYLLDDGEYYVCDALAVYFIPDLQRMSPRGRAPVSTDTPSIPERLPLGQRQAVKGRLRLATRCFLFEPDDEKHPVYKFPFKSIPEERIGVHERAESETRRGRSAASGTVFAFHCPVVVTMVERGMPRPFGHVAAEEAHCFTCSWEANAPFVERLNAYVAAFRSGDPVATELLLRRRWQEQKFELSWLGSMREKQLIEGECVRVLPLLKEQGRVLLTDAAFYFQSLESLETLTRVTRVPFADVHRFERRQWNLRDSAIEVQVNDGSVLFIAFPGESGQDHRYAFWRAVSQQPAVSLFRANDRDVMIRRWQEGDVSSLDYLMYLNWVAGRTVGDVSAYPVLPWVLSDYTSYTLDLSDRSVYRDLSKPIGALHQPRLEYFRKRMRDSGEPYLYGTHYSAPGHVVFFLFRAQPLWMLRMYNGAFDKGPRLFDSVPACWASVSSQPHDLKELVPEFYFGDGRFLLPGDHGDLGSRADGTPVRQQVELPPWADTPQQFVDTLRRALESEVCSASLHQWIDLIFGCKSRGDAALEANNLFHPLTYDAAGALASASGADAVKQVEAQAAEFGQCPAQLFTEPHPPRRCGETPAERINRRSYLPPDSDLAPPSSETTPEAGMQLPPRQISTVTPTGAIRLQGAAPVTDLVDDEVGAGLLRQLSRQQSDDGKQAPVSASLTRARAPTLAGRQYLQRALAAAVQTGLRCVGDWAPAPAVSGFTGGGDDRACYSPTPHAWYDSRDADDDSNGSDAGGELESEPVVESSRWELMMRRYFIESSEAGIDDMVWFVRRKRSSQADPAFLRRRTDGTTMPPHGDRTVAWRPSVLLNVAVQWDYELVAALVCEPPAHDGTHWAPDWIRTRVYASPAADVARGGCDSFQVTYPDLYFTSADPADGAAEIRVPPGAYMWALEVVASAGAGGRRVPVLRASVAHVEIARRMQLIGKQQARASENLIIGGDGDDHQTVQVSVSADESGGKWWRKGKDPRDSVMRCRVQWVACSTAHVAAAIVAASGAGEPVEPWLTLPDGHRRLPADPPPAPGALPTPPPDVCAGPASSADVKLSPTDFAAFWDSLTREDARAIDAGGSIDDAIRRWVDAGRPKEMQKPLPPAPTTPARPPPLVVPQSPRPESDPVLPAAARQHSDPEIRSRCESAAVEGEELEDDTSPARDGDSLPPRESTELKLQRMASSESSPRGVTDAAAAVLYRPQTFVLDAPEDARAAQCWRRCAEDPPKFEAIGPGSDFQGWASKKGGIKRGPLARGYSQRLFVVRGSFLFYFGVFAQDAPAKGCVFLYQARLHARLRRGSPRYVLEIASAVPRRPPESGPKGKAAEERVFHLAFGAEKERTSFAHALAPGALDLILK